MVWENGMIICSLMTPEELNNLSQISFEFGDFCLSQCLELLYLSLFFL